MTYWLVGPIAYLRRGDRLEWISGGIMTIRRKTQCHLVFHESHMTCTMIEPVPPLHKTMQGPWHGSGSSVYHSCVSSPSLDAFRPFWSLPYEFRKGRL